MSNKWKRWVLNIHAFTSSRWFWRKFIFCNNFITFYTRPPINQYHADESFSHNDTSVTKLLRNMSPTRAPSALVGMKRSKSGAYFWWFDKTKCHREARISLKAPFTLPPPMNHPKPCWNHEKITTLFSSSCRYANRWEDFFKRQISLVNFLRDIFPIHSRQIILKGAHISLLGYESQDNSIQIWLRYFQRESFNVREITLCSLMRKRADVLGKPERWWKGCESFPNSTSYIPVSKFTSILWLHWIERR